jgi:hypothetical protein
MKHGRRDLACDSRNEEPNTVRSNRTHKVLNTGQEDGEVGDAEEQGPDGNEAAKIIKPGTSANGQSLESKRSISDTVLTDRIEWFP